MEAARLVATFAVVWVHVAEAQGHPPAVAALGRFGTSFYLGAITLLTIRASEAPPCRSWAAKMKARASRLLLPFVVWSLVYGIFYGIFAWQRGDPFVELSRWWGPLAGTARHLWFLPFAFATGSVVSALAPRWARCTTRGLFWSTIGAALISYFLCHRVLFFALDRSWLHSVHLHRLDRWLEEIPLVVTATGGCLWARRLADRHASWLRDRARLLSLCVLLTFLVVEMLYVIYVEPLRLLTGSEARFFAHAAGLLLLTGFALSAQAGKRLCLSPLSRSTYFVFLAHILVLDWGDGLLRRMEGFGSRPFALVTTCTVFFGCLAVDVFRRWALSAGRRRGQFVLELSR